ncbi:toxin glutamine deamidase domain-containing protein [Actinosynnema sp. NPDC050436]|uniref:toxin glutamine deamidase domain-containing protein n=1 Tax=Actinosynnema sp. NPDC050436 TaxID=3155659 RepID=UPI0033FA4366
MTVSTMEGLQGKAGDFQSRLTAITGGLRGLQLGPNALGPIGLFAVPALNNSNDNTVSQAERAASTFGNVRSGLKATQETHVQTDRNSQKEFNKFNPDANAQRPPGQPGGGPSGGPKTGGPTVSKSDGPKGGGGTGPSGGPKGSGGPAVNPAGGPKGGGTGPSGGPKGPGGPGVGPVSGPKGGAGTGPSGGPKGPGGPGVGPVSGPKGGAGTGPSGGPKGGGPAVNPVGGPKGGTGTGPSGGPKGPGGPGVGPISGPKGGGSAPGGVPGSGVPGSGVPGSGVPGGVPGGGSGKGGGVPGGGVPGGGVPGGVPGGGVPGGGANLPPGGKTAVGGTPVATPPTTTTGPKGDATPPPPAGGVPPMGGAPGAPGGAGASERSSKYAGGSGKGLFDPPSPKTGDGTISKAPTGTSSTPPPAPKPTTSPSTSTPASNAPAANAPSANTPGANTPGGTPGGAPKPAGPSGTPSPTGPAPTGPAPTSGTTPPTSPTSAGNTPQPGKSPAPAPTSPVAGGVPPVGAPPAGAAPGAAGAADRSSKYAGGPGKGTFDAPQPKAGDGTISKAPATSPSTPPPAPTPTTTPTPAPTPTKTPNTPSLPNAPKFTLPKFLGGGKAEVDTEMTPVGTSAQGNANPNNTPPNNTAPPSSTNPASNTAPNDANPNDDGPAPDPKIIPSRNLPDFVQGGKALGTVAPTDVQGGAQVRARVDTLLGNPDGKRTQGLDQIESAIDNNFETLLGDGRKFQVRVGNKWFEATVRATLEPQPTGTPSATGGPKVDFTANSGITGNSTSTVATNADIGASATVGGTGELGGPYGSVGGKVALARPGVTTVVQTTALDQRAIRSGGGSTSTNVPVSFEVTVVDSAGDLVRPKDVAAPVPGSVTLNIPSELSVTPPVVRPNPATPRADFGALIEHPAPEAVTDLDSQKLFDDVQARLHPSVTKIGAPGRAALQDFLSPTTIRDNLGSMLTGWVTSPDLSSPNASYAGVVQMKATLDPGGIELVTTNTGAQLRLHDIATTGSGVTTNSKTGFDVTGALGGGLQVPGKLGGTAGLVAGYSGKITETSNSGTNTGNRAGVQVKSETGLYKVNATLEVRTPNGAIEPVKVTTYLRIGSPEAAAHNLPVRQDGPTGLITEGTAGTKFAPPYLASDIGGANVKVGEFAVAAQVQAEVEAALKKLPGMADFLPDFTDVQSDPRKNGKNFAGLVEQLDNQRKLSAELSPTALKTRMDSLIGPGIDVQLKKQGRFTNDFINVKVKAELTNGRHLGQVNDHNVRGWAGSGPRLDASTTTQKGVSAGVEAKVTIPKTSGSSSLTPTPTAGVKYTGTTAVKTTAGPAVNSSGLNVGASHAQVFRHDVEISVEITEYSRNRAWVKRVTIGSPDVQVPTPKVVAQTGATGPKVVTVPPIRGNVNLWMSDSSTFTADPAAHAPGGATKSTPDGPSRDVKTLLSTPPARPAPEILHVEAVAHSAELKKAAIEAMTDAAGGVDSSLTVEGSHSRNRIDKLFSPENLKANLTRLIDTGVQEGGLKHTRRVNDRTGAIGVKFELGNAQLVSISDKTGAESTVSGGFKASDSTGKGASWDFTAGVNVPAKPSSQPTGQGAVGVTGKWTPWSKQSTTGTEVAGNVDRVKITPANARTVLVRVDATATIVAETRNGNTAVKGEARSSTRQVQLDGGVFMRVSEDVARQLGALPNPAANPNPANTDPAANTNPAPAGVAPAAGPRPEMAPPKNLDPRDPGSLGLGMIESLPPELANLVPNLQADLARQGSKAANLIPKSVLDDSMNNLQRLVDLSSPTSVKALMDSAVDGGVPLLVHQPGTFGTDTYQVTLKAVLGDATFTGMAHDGLDVEHIIAGSTKNSSGLGRTTGWGAGVKVPGTGLPATASPTLSGSAGAAVGANVTHQTATSVSDSTSSQVGHKRVGTGPAARYSVPVQFQLVVERGDRQVATATSGDPAPMTVRLHADNHKFAPPATNTGPTTAAGPAPNAGPTTTDVTAPAPNTAAPAVPSPTSLPGRTPAQVEAWQAGPDGATLPPSASVESLRGAAKLREAAIRALLDADPKTPLATKGTGSLNSLLSSLSSETLQPQLPGMLTGPLSVPGLHEAALTFSKHADVKVYAKMTNPSLAGLSDGVKLENPRSTTSATSHDAKKSEVNDVVVGVAGGGLTDKGPNVLLSTPGAEFRHGGEVADGTSTGTTHNQVNDLKREGRTGLVEFDVEYQVVADTGKGKVSVVELKVPGAAQVRMPAADAQTVLGKRFDDLAAAQDAVKSTASAWREAEVALDKVAPAVTARVNGLATDIANARTAANTAATDVDTARGAHEAAGARVPDLAERVDAAKSALDNAGYVLDHRVAELQLADQRLEDAHAARPGAKADVDARNQAVADLESEVDSATKDVETAERAAQAAQQELDDHLANRPQPEAGQVPAPDQVADRLTGEAEAANQDLAAKRAELDRLSGRLPDARQRAEQATDRLAGVDQEVADAAARLADARSRVEDARTNLDGKTSAVETAERDLADATAEVERTKAALDEAGAKRQEAAETLAELENDLAQAEQQLAGSRADAAARQQAWWDAKQAIDQRIDAFNTRPAAAPQVAPHQQAPQPPPPPANQGGSSSQGTTRESSGQGKPGGSSRVPAPPPAPSADHRAPRPTSPATAPPATPGVDRTAPPASPGPRPEKSFTFEDGSTALTGPQQAELDSLVHDLADTTARREGHYRPPVVEVSGPNAQDVVGALAARGVDATVTPGRADGLDVKVDWDLKRPEGWTPPAAPVGAKVTDTVITSPAPQGPHPVLDDPSWRHSTEPRADWFDPKSPVPNAAIERARVDAPITGRVRGEDGGVLSNSTVGPDGVDLKSWRGPIAYDIRTLDVGGVPVRDFTVKLHLKGDPDAVAGIRERTRAGVDELFNQGNRLPTDSQFHVTVEFTDNPADAHGTVDVTDPDGRANQLAWPADTDPRRLAHEVGHFLGLHDEYFETDDVKPVFQHRDGHGRVVGDNGPMTAGIDQDNASLKPRNLWLIENRATALVSSNDLDARAEVGPDVRPPNAPGFFTRTPPQAAPAPPLPVAHPLPAVLPGTALPPFFQGNQALGSVATTGVHGVDHLTSAITALVPPVAGATPVGVEHIGHELDADFESFLGNGRTFQVKVGGNWYDTRVTAVLGPATGSATASPAKVDSRVDSGATSTTTTNLSTGNDLSLAATASQGAGAYGALGVKAPLSTPVTASTSTTSAVDDREIRGGDTSKKYDVPVSYRVTLTDARDVVVVDRVVEGDAANPMGVSLQVPDDLATLANTDHALPKAEPDAGVGARIEHLVPEAVGDFDADAAFRQVAAQLHPSVVKPGADGRTALRDFLSATTIRDNLHVMLEGWVTSPNLASPHSSYGSAVQMKATLVDAELVGTHGGAQFRMHHTSTTATSVTTSVSSGVEVTAAVGGGVGTPGVPIGTAGVTGSVSSKTSESSTAGGTAVTRSGIQVGGQTGLYKVTVAVEVRTPHGDPVSVPATAYVRVGLGEAKAQGLPTPDGTPDGITPPTPGNRRFEAPYLAAGLAAGNIRVGALSTTGTDVRAEVEAALKGLDGFADFLPTWGREGRPQADGKNAATVDRQVENQRRLDAELSPTALKARMDSLLGPGVQVQLKREGRFADDYVNVTVRARLGEGDHLGAADGRTVRGLHSAGPRLDSATTTTKGWSAGLEGRGGANVKPGSASLAPTATAAAKYSRSTTAKTTAGPAVTDVALNVGSSKAQVFAHDVEFEIEITEFSRRPAWVRRVTPGSPLLQVPQPRTVARPPDPDRPLDPTARGNPKIIDKVRGTVRLWASDGSTLTYDPEGLAPRDAVVAPLPASTTITSVINPGVPRPQHLPTRPGAPDTPGRVPPRNEWLHVEAVANAGQLRAEALKLLDAAAGPDTALTVPGTEARNQVDRLFSPENLKANLRRMAETGLVEDTLRYDRRVTDRTGALGVSVTFAQPKLVSISDTTPTEVWTGGGFKAAGSGATARSVEGSFGVGLGGKPNDATPQGGSTVGATGKVTPWSRTATTSTEVGGNVDRKLVRHAGERTVLVQLDAAFTVVGESRSGNALHGGTPRSKAATVTLPGGVFVRVGEQVARDMGLLEDVPPHTSPDFGAMKAPKRLDAGQPSSLGLGTVDDVPDLSRVVGDLTKALHDRTSGRTSAGLVPDSVLKDSMRNLRRLVDLTSPTSVKGLVDSAMDGGVPLLLHKPGAVFGKDTYQVTLRAKTGTPAFLGAVNDGYDIEHITTGSRKDSAGLTKGTSAGLSAKAAGLHLPDVKDGMSPSVGGAVGAGLGWSQSRTTTDTTAEQSGHKHTATGPAVRYAVPVEFELVVHKGGEEIASASLATEGMTPPPAGAAPGTAPKPMTVRLHADNVRADVAGVTGTRRDYHAEATTRPAAEARPDRVAAWQAAGTPTTPPAGSSVEGMRGAQDVRLAAIEALRRAGAGDGITGRGTGSRNALLSALSSETLQSALPGMTSGPLTVPGLHQAALGRSQHADLKVYAKLVNPRLDSLSDGVKLENPSSTTRTTTAEAKRAQTGDVVVGVPVGGFGRKAVDGQGATDLPNSANFSGTGVELKHSGEDSTTGSGAPLSGTAQNLKPSGRSGLVEFDVEYRFVAEVDGKVGVYDLVVPGSADLRMALADVEGVLDRPIPPEVATAQNGVRDTARTWRTAQAAVETARHTAQDLLAERTGARTDVPGLETAVETRLGAVDAAFEVLGTRERESRAARDQRDAAVALVESRAEASADLDLASRRADLAVRTADGAARLGHEQVEGLELQVETVDGLFAKADADLRAAESALAEFDRAHPPVVDPAGVTPPRVDPGRGRLADAVELNTRLRDGWRTERAGLAERLDAARHSRDEAVRRQEAATREAGPARDAAAQARADLATAEAAVGPAQERLDAATGAVREARQRARLADEARIDAERAHQDAVRKVADLDARIAEANAELGRRHTAADTAQAAWWAAKIQADTAMSTFTAPPSDTTPPTAPQQPNAQPVIAPQQAFGSAPTTSERGFGAPADGTPSPQPPSNPPPTTTTAPAQALTPEQRKAARDKAVGDLAARQAAERTAERTALQVRQAQEKQKASTDLAAAQAAEYQRESRALTAKLDAEGRKVVADTLARQQTERTGASTRFAERMRAEQARAAQQITERHAAERQRVVNDVLQREAVENQQFVQHVTAQPGAAPAAVEQVRQQLLAHQQVARQNADQQVAAAQQAERQQADQQFTTWQEGQRQVAEQQFENQALAERQKVEQDLEVRQEQERKQAEQDLKNRQQTEREQVERQLDTRQAEERKQLEERLHGRQAPAYQAEVAKWLPPGTKHHGAFADDAEAGRWADARYPGLAGINRDNFRNNVAGHNVNCTNCVIATHEALHGRPVAAPPLPAPQHGDYLENHFGAKFQDAANYHQVADYLGDRPGRHVSIGISRDDGTGHVFNGWNDGGHLTFYDAQAHLPAKLEHTATRIQFIPLPDLPAGGNLPAQQSPGAAPPPTGSAPPPPPAAPARVP